MRIIALIAVRNESLYIGRCLEHLHSQGIYTYLIDNGSTDDTVEIAGRFADRGLVGVEQRPYAGFYDWTGLLERKDELARKLDADWFIHQDADEILEAADRRSSLLDAIRKAASEGYNAINFDEFVFLPVREEDDFEGTDYVAGMKHYYFHEPHALRLVRCWERGHEASLVASAGHNATFDGRRVYPHNFILRHYIFLSARHAMQKYGRNRRYAPGELDQGWHRARAQWIGKTVRLPNGSETLEWKSTGQPDRSKPKRAHIFSFT